MKHELPDSEIVEVVLKKEMTMEAYRNLLPGSRKKGWKVQAYQLGRHSEGCKTKIEIE